MHYESRIGLNIMSGGLAYFFGNFRASVVYFVFVLSDEIISQFINEQL